MKKLFKLFDLDQSGEIDFREFKHLMAAMHLGLKQEETLQLFQYCDEDGEGTISEKEFVRALFPDEFVELYGKSLSKEVEAAGKAKKRQSERPSSAALLALPAPVPTIFPEEAVSRLSMRRLSMRRRSSLSM